MNQIPDRIIVFFLLIAVSFMFMHSNLAGEKPVIIGVVQNLTGPWASIDGPSWKGIQLAADEINGSGGILGRPVMVKCIDTRADDSLVSRAVTDLIEKDKVSVIIGYSDTNWVLTAASIALKHNIPFITPGATDPLIPDKTAAWLACFGDNVQAAVMAEWAFKEMGLKKAALWIDNTSDFSIIVSRYFEDAFSHFGGEVIYCDYFETGSTDYSDLVKRLKESEKSGRIDSVYIGAVPGNIGLIVRQIRKGGVTVPVLGEDGFDTPLLIEEAGEHAEGVVFVTHISLNSPDEHMQEFIKKYSAKYNNAPENAFAVLGYDTMNLVAEAIKLAGSDDPIKIAESLSRIKDFPGIAGSISYSRGNKVPQKSVSVMVVKNGSFSTLSVMKPSYVPDPGIVEKETE